MRNKLENYTTMEIYNELEKRLKDSADVMEELANECNDKEQEIERLNSESTEWESRCYKYQDIIDELEKWVKENNINDRDIYGYEMEDKVIYLEDFLNKLKELKEGKE